MARYRRDSKKSSRREKVRRVSSTAQARCTPATQTNHGDTEITESSLIIPFRDGLTRSREGEDAMNVDMVSLRVFASSREKGITRSLAHVQVASVISVSLW